MQTTLTTLAKHESRPVNELIPDLLAAGLTQYHTVDEFLPKWESLSPRERDVAALACLGCGACAYACPVCHCFDLQDESDGKECRRLRNWDSCGFGLFTLHASGHNPRPDQSARWRQRVMHKFSIYPQKFKTLACTGCGRCSRLCQAGMAIAQTCERIEALSR